MTPTRIIQDWYSNNDHDIRECGIDDFHATELMTALAPLFAAGPWRTDVENIDDYTNYLCEYPNNYAALDGLCIKLDSKRFSGRFATINPPETTP